MYRILKKQDAMELTLPVVVVKLICGGIVRNEIW